ncbi:MAG: hypothetical protein C0622_12985 [Desulfuromonas sp.]|nr:MAG: hypothetical protein C0622_12985 [Desulfuromonas sp.]
MAPYSTDENLAVNQKLVQKRLLLPIGIIFVGLFIAFSVYFFNLQKQELRRDCNGILINSQAEFAHILQQQTSSLRAILEALQRDDFLVAGLRAADRDLLFGKYADLFISLRNEHNVTHFYFHTSDRVNLLRVHMPDRYGDQIDRFTAREAERTGLTASGIELGPLGTFTLRVVMPIRDQQGLVGYLELGKEIDDALSQLHSEHGMDYFVGIDKSYLNPAEWETGMRMLGEDADWDLYEDFVTVHRSSTALPVVGGLWPVQPRHGEDGGLHELDNEGRTWYAMPFPLIDASNQQVGALVLFEDVTSQKHALRYNFLLAFGGLFSIFIVLTGYLALLLRKTDKQLLNHQRSLLDSNYRIRKYFDAIDEMNIGLILIDQNFRVLESNRTIQCWFGKEERPFCYQRIIAADKPCSFCHMRKVIEQGQRFRFENSIPDGRIFDIISTPFQLADGSACVMEVVQDITAARRAEEERWQLEAQLRQKLKMEGIGVMAGGIAHNFNNNLAIILGNIELAQRKISDTNKLTKYLENARTAVLRSRDLVTQILTYSRQGSKRKEATQPFLVADETMSLLLSTLPPSVQLEYRVSEEARKVHIEADVGQLQEALLNLCTNAIHAMDEQGELIVRLREEKIEQSGIPAQYDCRPGHYVILSVADSGSGMDPETLEKVFDPFFTTKEVNKGTGMGLATVQGVVKQHGGFIRVFSAPGLGSTFELCFPTVKQLIAQSEKTDEEESLTGSEAILLVDDDEVLLSLGRQILTDLGYRVTVAKSGAEALAYLRRHPEQFDLLITDQTMPRMSGRDLTIEVHKLGLPLPIILTSGYSSQVSEEDIQKYGISAYCSKPLRLNELSRIVRTVIDDKVSVDVN